MEITEVFYPETRADWRQWLQTNYQTKPEVWVQVFNKASGKPAIAYDDLVEECLCFGWIDGITKKYDDESSVRRITPRRKGSYLSELNRQRVWKLQAQGLILPGALDVIQSQIGHPDDVYQIPDWVLTKLQADPQVWANFQAFPLFYQRLKIGWIAEIKGTSRQAEAQKRLDYLIKMTRAGKRYGEEPLKEP